MCMQNIYLSVETYGWDKQSISKFLILDNFLMMYLDFLWAHFLYNFSGMEGAFFSFTTSTHFAQGVCCNRPAMSPPFVF